MEVNENQGHRCPIDLAPPPVQQAPRGEKKFPDLRTIAVSEELRQLGAFGAARAEMEDGLAPMADALLHETVRDVLERRHGHRRDYTPNLGLKCNRAGWRRLQATESAPGCMPSEWLTALVLDK